MIVLFFFQAEDGIRDYKVTGVQTCALPILERHDPVRAVHPAPGEARPLLRRAARVAREPREPAQAPARLSADLARRVACDHRPVGGRRLLAAVEVVEDLGAPVERLGRLRVAARRRGVERDERLLGLASALEELTALELERGLLDGRRARHRLLEGARGGLVPAELP